MLEQKNDPDPILPAPGPGPGPEPGPEPGPWPEPGQPWPGAADEAWYDRWSDCSDEADSRWDQPLRPVEHPREWATRLGFPPIVVDNVGADFMTDEDYAQFATPMRPGESVRKWAEGCLSLA